MTISERRSEIKGKFIFLVADLLADYPGVLATVTRELEKVMGHGLEDLDPEGWYDIQLYSRIFDIYAGISRTRLKLLTALDGAILTETMGQARNVVIKVDYVSNDANLYETLFMNILRTYGIKSGKVKCEGADLFRLSW